MWYTVNMPYVLSRSAKSSKILFPWLKLVFSYLLSPQNVGGCHKILEILQMVAYGFLGAGNFLTLWISTFTQRKSVFSIILKVFFQFLNWNSLQARLESHYEAWSYKKKKNKKVKSKQEKMFENSIEINKPPPASVDSVSDSSLEANSSICYKPDASSHLE